MKIRIPSGRRRLTAALRPVQAAVVVALALTALGVALVNHRDIGRSDSARQAIAALRELRERLYGARTGLDEICSGQSPAGLFSNLQERSDVGLLEESARRALQRSDSGRRELETATRELDTCLDLAHETALLEIEASLDRRQEKHAEAESLEARAAARRDSFDLRLARSVIRMDRLAEHLAGDLERGTVAAHRSEMLLAFSFLGLAALAWRIRIIRRRQEKHLEGARLVEDMLEAYSRRLEMMNAELEQVGLLKTQFLANTSHELLTPLNGVMGSLELLREGGCTPGEESEFLTQAYHSAETLLSLIHDLLDLCRLEEGNLALRCRAVEFGSLLERTVARHRKQIEGRGLTLLTIPPPEGWPRIQADPERLGQVVQHLLSNAVKFTEGGSIRISGRVERAAGDHLRVEVADTGIGIEPEKLPEVFELFSQADGSSTRRFGGTGLGLTLCRHLVQGMGGRIGIESDGRGRGTRVWFTLPLAREQSAEGIAPAA